MPNGRNSRLPTLYPIVSFPFKWLTLKRLPRILKWVCIVTLTLGILITLLHLIENYRGKREWERIKAEVEAKGINLNWADYIPEPIPDEINFVAAPIIAHFQYESDSPHHVAWQERWGDKAHFNTLFISDNGGVVTRGSTLEGETRWHESRFVLNERRRERLLEEGKPIIPEGIDPWQQLEAQIEPHKQLFAEIRQAAATRTESYIHGNYTEMPFDAPFPNFQTVRNYTRLLYADALIALRADDTERALQNAHAIQRMGNLNSNMYTLVNSMIETVCIKDFQLPIYQLALKNNKLNSQHLHQLIKQSLDSNALADLERSYHYEIAGAAEAITQHFEPNVYYILSSPVDQSTWENLTEQAWILFFNSMPEGWVHIMAARCIHYEAMLIDPYDIESRKLDINLLEQNGATFEEMTSNARFFDLLAAMTIPAFSRITETSLTRHCQQDMLGIACALELYLREHGDLPNSLSQLTPEYISTLFYDPVSTEPYCYERIDTDNYRLWAVGIDGVDNGGHIDPDAKYGKQADIVWPLSHGAYN